VNVTNAVVASCVTVNPGPLPTLTKSFSSTRIAPGGIATLHFTLTKPPPATPGQLGQQVSFVDTLPAGVQVAAVGAIQSDCFFFTGSAIPGSKTINVTNATILVPNTCTISVNVTNVPGQEGTCPNASFTNTTANISGTVNVINAVVASCVTVTSAPQTPSLVEKTFSPTTINAGGTSTLTFTLANPDFPDNPAQTVSFIDTLPSGLQIAAARNFRFTCTGVTATASSGNNTITVTSATVAASIGQPSLCTLSVDVTNVAGQFNASCANNPAAFTNGRGNISGLSNLTNEVMPSCLVVTGAQIPTMSECAFIALMLVLATAGAMYVRRGSPPLAPRQ
jgi:uncharacterized repeat protein (TIGR01451 family)